MYPLAAGYLTIAVAAGFVVATTRSALFLVEKEGQNHAGCLHFCESNGQKTHSYCTKVGCGLGVHTLVG